MKRFLATILALIYLTASSGMVMNSHYCMGKLSSVKLAITPVKKCGCGKMEKKGCCRTETKLLKLDNTHKATYASLTIKLPMDVPVAYTNLLHTSFISASVVVLPQAHAPPLLSEQDIYLRNCVFRI